MERLTYKNGRGRWALMIDGKEYTGKIAERLAAYENIGAPDYLTVREETQKETRKRIPWEAD